MAVGKLVHTEQSFSVDVEIDNKTEKMLEETSDGESIDINVTVWKCIATQLPDVAIHPPFKNLEILSGEYEINSISGFPAGGKIAVVRAGTVLSINVTVRVGAGGSAFFQ